MIVIAPLAGRIVKVRRRYRRAIAERNRAASRMLAALALGIAAIAPRQSADAQSSPGVKGRVEDPTGAAISLAEVYIAGLRFVTQTDVAGQFAFRLGMSGHVTLRIRRLGYSPGIRNIDVLGDSATQVVVTLEPWAENLAPVNTSSRLTSAIEGFHHRRSLERGFYVTREEIESRHVSRLSDMLRSAPGIALLRSLHGGMAIRFLAAPAQRRDCRPQYWLDGARADNLELDELSPSTVEGMELYQGPASTPAHFSDGGGTPSCGTILIWSRVPGS